MPQNFQNAEKLTLPLIVLGGVVAFPTLPIHFEVSDEPATAAAQAALATDGLAMLVSLTAPVDDTDYTEDDLYRVGTVVKIVSSAKGQEGGLALTCHGVARAHLLALHRMRSYYTAQALCAMPTATPPDLQSEALTREVKSALANMAAFIPNADNDLLKAAAGLSDAGALADFVALHFLVRFEDKQTTPQSAWSAPCISSVRRPSCWPLRWPFIKRYASACPAISGITTCASRSV